MRTPSAPRHRRYFGVDLNAFYDREGLKFFHGSAAAGRTVFSGESPDIVCHELGHALLDSFKPQLFDAASIEVAALDKSRSVEALVESRDDEVREPCLLEPSQDRFGALLTCGWRATVPLSN
jgi:hypothetical protein